MERKGDEDLKSEENREAVQDERRDGKLSPVFRMEKKKIVGKYKNKDNNRGENNARARQALRKSEIFERFLEKKANRQDRKNREKKKREPKCLAVRGLRKNQADDENKRGAKDDQEIPAG